MFDVSQFLLKGKTDIVTEGGRVLGRVIARGYARVEV